MGKSISFFVPGPPKGKARVKVTKFGNFTPEGTLLYENFIKTCFLEAYGKTGVMYPDKEPVSICINAFFGIPNSASKKKAALMASNEILPTKKPDIDNIGKVVADALNGIAYKDDTQIVDLHIQKRYTEESEGLMILIDEAPA